MAECAFCPLPLDDQDPEVYREVTSWVHGPKLDGPKLREQTGRLAHKHCIDNLVAGQAPDQPELFPKEGTIDVRPKIVRDLLLLVVHGDSASKIPSVEWIEENWPLAVRAEVIRWASAVHLAASDNDVPIPPVPAVIRVIQ